MNCDHCSSLIGPRRVRVDQLRLELCTARIEADFERQNYSECCIQAEESLKILTRQITASRSKNAASKSHAAELESSTKRFMEDSKAASKQLQRLRDAETTVKEIETCIENMNVWFVHIPQHPLALGKADRSKHVGHQRKDSGVSQVG